jgi:hypothetical protein
LSKPEINDLKHQNLLSEEIIHAKNRHAMSLWWLLIPLYVIATLTMKTLYMKTSIKQEIILFKANNQVLSALLFLISPVLIIIFNLFFSAKRNLIGTLLTILASILLLIYILTYV